ncbi:hypothetical protein ON010_g6026 [Phytophthora cinnamomi]|nr:hypothetical protein ON010_g6026 [Phytophthora cinnamomi]
MIHPLELSSQPTPPFTRFGNYQIVGLHLPAFDPLRTVKTILLTPASVKMYNLLVRKHSHFVRQTVVVAITLRLATFAVPSSMGRVLGPMSAVFHIPGITVFVAGMRTEYATIVARTFDFWFIQLANAIWAITFSAVLMDLRVILVVTCSAVYTISLFQETNLRTTSFMVLVSVWELVFCLMLMAWLSLGLVADVHHHALIIARGHTLSTKDVLADALGTMATMTLRNMYRRHRHVQHQRTAPEKRMQALGYRCIIALRMIGPHAGSLGSVVMFPACNAKQVSSGTKLLNVIKGRSQANRTEDRVVLQMYLATEYTKIDPHKTVWPRVGALEPIATWKSAVLYACGAIGAGLAALSVFLTEDACGAAEIAVSALVTSVFFSGVHLCCCQRHLLKSIMTSFHFLFLLFQIVAIGVCVVDMLRWRWHCACGVMCSGILAYTVLTVDALTPAMKHRLRFNYWMVVGGIALFWLVQVVLLLDVLVLGQLDLKDRVFLDFVVMGTRSQFHVAPFLLSRVVTVLVWSARYVFVALVHHTDNALVLLRGNVEFEYGS